MVVKFEDHILLWDFDEFKKIYSGLGSRISAFTRKKSNEEYLTSLYENMKCNYDFYKTMFNGIVNQKRCNVKYEDDFRKRIIISADLTETLQIEGSPDYKIIKNEEKTIIPVSQNKNEFNLILDSFLQEKVPSEGELTIDYKFKSTLNLGTESKCDFTKNPKKMDSGLQDWEGLYFGEPGKVYYRHIQFHTNADKTKNEILHSFAGHRCYVNQRKNIGLNGTMSVDDKLVFAGTFDSDGWWPFVTFNEPKPENEKKKASEYTNVNPKQLSIKDYKTA